MAQRLSSRTWSGLRTRFGLSAMLLVPLLAACGGGPPASADASGSPAASATASGAGASDAMPSGESAAPSADASAAAGPTQYLACDPAGPGWPVTALDRSPDAETGTTAAAKALAEYLAGPDGTDLPASGWIELYRSKEMALYGQADSSGEPGLLLTATMRQTGGTWAGEDNSQCRPRTWLGTSLGMAADWTLAAKTSKTSKTLKTLVTERSCAGGASAKGRIAKPRITYETDRVIIIVPVKPLEGAQDCQSNPATPYTITLTKALGTRDLYDGGSYPETPVKQPK